MDAPSIGTAHWLRSNHPMRNRVPRRSGARSHTLPAPIRAGQSPSTSRPQASHGRGIGSPRCRSYDPFFRWCVESGLRTDNPCRTTESQRIAIRRPYGPERARRRYPPARRSRCLGRRSFNDRTPQLPSRGILASIATWRHFTISSRTNLRTSGVDFTSTSTPMLVKVFSVSGDRM